MKLIISIIIHIIQKMSRCSPKTGIPPLIPKRLDTCMLKGIVGMATGGELNKLLGPIKNNRYCYHEKTIPPIQRAFNKYGDHGTQNHQRKKMPPDKLQHPLWFIPNIFLFPSYLFHCLRLLSDSLEYGHLLNTLSCFLIKTNGSSMKETGVNKP